MATAAKRATKLTTLMMGQVEMSVGLFATADKPGKLAQFTTAGPNGGALKAEIVARATPVSEVADETPDVPVHSSDPLGDEFVKSMDSGLLNGPVETVERPAWPEGDLEWQRATAAVKRMESTDEVPEKLRQDLGVAEGHGQAVHDAMARSLGEAVSSTVDTLDPDGTNVPLQQVAGEYGRQLVEEGTGVVVAPEDVRRGVRLDDDRFIDCTAQLAEIEDATRLEQMSVVSFVDVTHVPRSRVTGAYYIGAADERAPKPLRMLFEALKATRRAAVVKVTKRSRQSLGVITATGGVLMFHELVWSEDFRPAPARALAIQKAAVSEAEVAMAVELVRAMSGTIETLDKLRDDAIAMREELHAKAVAGEVAEVVTPAPAREAQDVLAQLEASLAGVSA